MGSKRLATSGKAGSDRTFLERRGRYMVEYKLQKGGEKVSCCGFGCLWFLLSVAWIVYIVHLHSTQRLEAFLDWSLGDFGKKPPPGEFWRSKFAEALVTALIFLGPPLVPALVIALGTNAYRALRDRWPRKVVVHRETLADYQARLDEEERRHRVEEERRRKSEQERLRKRRELARIEEEKQEAERRKMEEEERKRRRAEVEKQSRIAACRFDDWRPDDREPWVFDLPASWTPITRVGLALANVVPYASMPPAQEPWFDTYKTTGPTPVPKRGIYLAGTSHKRPMSRSPLVVDPNSLPGTANDDLVVFGLTAGGFVAFLFNPFRNEKRIDPSLGDEGIEKAKMLLPVLAKLYEKAAFQDDQGSGWA